MLIEFYEDKNNRDLVRTAHVEFDMTRVMSMLMTLPGAMLSLIWKLPQLPASEYSDIAADEAYRKALNNIITLAGLLEELLDVVMTHKTMIGIRELEDSYLDAIDALRELQKRKDERIDITHRDLGSNFGSATGFQTHNYAEFAQKVVDWMENTHARAGGGL